MLFVIEATIVLNVFKLRGCQSMSQDNTNCTLNTAIDEISKEKWRTALSIGPFGNYDSLKVDKVSNNL